MRLLGLSAVRLLGEAECVATIGSDHVGFVEGNIGCRWHIVDQGHWDTAGICRSYKHIKQGL